MKHLEWLLVFFSLTALALPKFQRDDNVIVKSNCTDDVAFCKLKGKTGTILNYEPPFMNASKKYFYGVSFPIKDPQCEWMQIPEDCLEKTK